MSNQIKEAWDSVEEYTQDAKAIAFDGCHKIYLLMDHGQVEQMLKYGYGDGSDDSRLIHAVGSSPEEMFATVKDWYAESCSLKFVNAVESVPEGENPNDGFTNLVEQGIEDADVCDECNDSNSEGEWVDGRWYCLGCQPEVQDEDEDEEDN